MFEYKTDALKALSVVMPGLNNEELLAVQRTMLEGHVQTSDELAKRGWPQPGNDPERPN